MHIIPYTRRVNYYETDQMGIVHHSNYLRYFEEARLDCLLQAQCDTQEMERRGIIIPNVDAYVKYIKPLRYGETFTVTVKPVSFTGVRMRLEYEIERDGELCSTGYTTHCFVDPAMKPLVLRRGFPDVFDRFHALFADGIA